MFDFGLRLKELRKKKHLSQYDLSIKINKSKSVISGYENNVKLPPLDVLISLALIYNVSLDYLAGIDKNEMIYIDKLSTKQKDLIHIILSEFEEPKANTITGLSKRQQDILNALIVEFTTPNKNL